MFFWYYKDMNNIKYWLMLVQIGTKHEKVMT